MKNPKPEVVLKHLEDVPKMGIVDQTSTGMIYLDIDDDFIWKALEVLRPFGYARPGFFTYPPPPVGAHIKIVTAEEAMDRELLPHKTPPSPEPGEHNLYLGEKVDFEVERAYKSQPKLRRYGIVAKYKLKVNSPELEKIRRELTGLAPPKTGFYITLAILIEEIVGPYTDLEDGKNENSLTQKIKEEDLDDEKKRKKGKSEADKSSEEKKSQKKKDDESTDDEKKRKKTSAPSERSSKPKKKSGMSGMPKKPMSPYFLWLNEEGREEIKKDNPGIGVTDVAKAAGEKWKEIDEETKKKYEEKNKELMEKYEEEYKEWFESGGKEALENAKKAKEKKEKSEADKSSEDKKSQKKKDDESTDDENKRKKGKTEADKSSEEKGSDVKKSKEKKGKSEADKSSENKKSKKKKDDESTDDESTDDEKSESKKTRKKKGKETRKRDLNTKEDEKVKIKFDDEEEVINKNLLIASIAVNSLTIIVLGFIINSE